MKKCGYCQHGGKAPMYLYATEMVSSYYQRLSLKGKRVLTIAGSGDQVINALFYGAKEVVGFDINRNALFMTELKVAGIRTFSYQEFFRFFSQTKKGFHHTLYNKARPALPRKCQRYFDNLYKTVGPSGLGLSHYFRKRGERVHKTKTRHINAYLATETAYRKMQKILRNINPILRVANVLHLPGSVEFRKTRVDLINLSNAPNILVGRSFALHEKSVLSCLRELKQLVSTHGAIFFYSYDDSNYPNSTLIDVPVTSRSSFLKEIKQSAAFCVSQKSFPGITAGKRDRITILGC